MDDEIPRHRSKKDKKRWCQGKVGVEHEPKCEVHPSPFLKDCRVLRCQKCAKILELYIPLTWVKDPSPPPPWVTF